jgi:hypothetical protein
MRMRARAATFAVVALLAAAALAGLGVAAPNRPHTLAQKGADGTIPVDVELVLAVDVSYSMDPEEQELQREGYMAAITSREFMLALREGMHGKIAMTYFEWAGEHHNQIIVPWRLIDGPEAADGFAADSARARYTRASRTSIAGAMRFAAPLFESSGYRGIRRVLDISGDQRQQQRPPGRGDADGCWPSITINGRDHAQTAELRHDGYRQAQHLRGLRDRQPGAFVVRWARLVQAIAPAPAGWPAARPARVVPASAGSAHPLHHRRRLRRWG